MFPLIISQRNIKLIPSPSLQDDAYDLQSVPLKKLINSNAVINFFSYIHLFSPPKKNLHSPQYHFHLITEKASGFDLNN